MLINLKVNCHMAKTKKNLAVRKKCNRSLSRILVIRKRFKERNYNGIPKSNLKLG